MFRLNEAVADWRARLSGILTRDEIEELEDHLASSIEARLAQGDSPEEAFVDAARDLGDVVRLSHEYSKGTRAVNLVSKLSGSAFMLTLLVLASFPVGLATFVNGPALLLVIGLVTGGLWSCFGLRNTFGALRASIAGGRVVDPDKHTLYLGVAQRGYHLAWAGGVFGTLIGIIQMLSRLEDPSMLGAGLATCLLALFYGAILAELIFRNMRQWLMNLECPA